MKKTLNITKNEWSKLSKFTNARIALGRAGNSLSTKEMLSFQLSHAKAIDAVHTILDTNIIKNELKNILQKDMSINILKSKSKDRFIYLQRPDLGRILDDNSKNILKKENKYEYDLAIIIADGLSSLAIQENAIKFINKLNEELENTKLEYKIAPYTIVTQARVAIADEIGELLNAKITIILIGERPGLSSPNSMGLYLTYNPKINLNDSNRNCISNIRKNGLSYDDAVNKTMYLLNESRKLGLSGINLKDRTQDINVQIENKEDKYIIF